MVSTDPTDPFAHITIADNRVSGDIPDPFAHIPVTPPPSPFKTGPSYGGTDLAGVDLDSLSSRPGRVLQGGVEQTLGGVQALTHGAGYLASGFGYAPNAASRALDQASGAVDAEVNQVNRIGEEASRLAGVKQGETDWWKLGGKALAPTNYAIPGGAVVKGGALARGALAGALYGASEPVVTGQGQNAYAPQKASQVAAGTAGGALAGPLVEGAGALLGGVAMAPAVRTLEDAGVSVPVGTGLGAKENFLGRMARATEQKSTSIPGVGDMVLERYRDAGEQFARGAWNKVVEPIGEKLPADIHPGEDALVWAKGKLESAYGNILKGAKGSYDPYLEGGVQKILKSPDALTLATPQADMLDKIITHQIVNRVDANNAYSPEVMQSIKSYLGSKASSLSSSAESTDRDLGKVIWKLKDEFSGMIERHNPGIAPKLKAADDAWARFIPTSMAASKAAVAQNRGLFTPAQLNSSVAQSSKTLRKIGYGTSATAMAKYTRAGVQALNQRVPNSGTTDRGLIATLGSGLVGITPPGAAAMLGGAAAYTKPGQNLLKALLYQRPEVMQAAGGSVNRVAPFAAAGSSALVQSLLAQRPQHAH
jgi:hypothetical protein